MEAAARFTALLHDEFWLNAFFAAEWAVRLAMIVVVPFRRSPEAAKGWLLLIFFEPTIGLILYGLIGRPTLPAWRVARHVEFEKLSHPIFERLAAEPNIFHPDVGPELNKAVTLAENLGELPILGGNALEVLADYDGFVDRLIDDIGAARDHVHLLFYIIADDATTWRVIEALQQAAERGVVCRVLADSLGSRPDFDRLKPKLEAAGILAEETMRVGLFRRAGRLDLRNHRKIAVIDGRIAYTGSQNLVDATFKEGLTYEELNVRMAGPVALELQAVFAEDWYVETGEFLGDPRYVPDPEVRGNIAVQTLPSGPGYPRENNLRLIVSLIHAANLRVFITMPYLVPDDALQQALTTAALRGVDVTLVVPRQIDQYLVGYGQRSYYEEMMEAGVRICRYGKRFLHAKCVTIDDTIAWIGSSNLDIRSFALNAEVVVLIYDTGVCNRLAVEQQRYLRDGEMLELERWQHRNPVVKVAENLARLLSPLL
ncbi:MAG TPA: cardiolipin synthase [Casimicrobiaceae bacterium]|nr:cardiolipin synthase [Casimicrobiaceae bacterium]